MFVRSKGAVPTGSQRQQLMAAAEGKHGERGRPSLQGEPDAVTYEMASAFGSASAFGRHGAGLLGKTSVSPQHGQKARRSTAPMLVPCPDIRTESEITNDDDSSEGEEYDDVDGVESGFVIRPSRVSIRNPDGAQFRSRRMTAASGRAHTLIKEGFLMKHRGRVKGWRKMWYVVSRCLSFLWQQSFLEECY
jgi:hypothetical protein